MLEQEGVTPEESPASEDQEVIQDVNQTEESSSQETSQTDEGESQALDPEIYDPTGVPWKNRAAERERKLADLAEKLPNMIEEQVSKLNTTQKPQEPKYSIDDLEAFMESNPEHRGWAQREIRKLEREELRQELRKELGSVKSEQQNAQIKSQAEATVLKTFPNMFVKDNQGNVVGWNQNDPMTSKVAEYLRDPMYANNPRGLELASKQAYADLALNGQLTVQKNNKTLKKQVRQLEQKTLPEGDSKSPVETKTQLQHSMERLSKSGSVRDAQEVLRQQFKKLNWIKE